MQHPHSGIRLTAPSRGPTLRIVTEPVVLVHGWGGSFASTWERSGFTALLADAGRDVIGVDLLGHGTAPKPHDPAAYIDLSTRIVDALPGIPVDAVGFSLGALTLLRTAIAAPERFHRLVLAGVGRNVFERDDAATARILAAIEGTADVAADDNLARLFGQYATIEGNDARALAAVLRRPDPDPITPADLGRVACPVLVVLGDHDFAQPADALVDALPDARYVELRNTDHFATPESFAFIDAVLGFLDAVPA
jgi:pimeloyl-ACP methyl ester carboxylesterase